MTRNTVSRGRSRWIAAAAMAAAGAMLLSACGGSAPTKGEGGGSDEDLELVLSVVAAPRSLDPAQLDGGTQAYVWGAIYDTLLFRDEAGELQPNAAESWEVSDDALTITFKIREGMTFSNGEPVDAAAVKNNMDRNAVTPGQEQEKFVNVSSVETPDDYTVVVNFSAPDPAFLYNMAVDGGVISDPSTVDDERTPTNPVGSGPYELNVEETVNGSNYVLERRDDYWNVDAYPYETIEVTVLADRTAGLNALLSGQVDFATVQANELGQVQSSGKFNVVEVEGTSTAYLNLADRDGTKIEALGDVNVRRAINYAFDREGIVEKLMFGSGVPAVQPFSPKSDGHNADLEGTYTYDPEKARELLAEAGYADGFTVTMPSTVASQTFEPTITQSLGDIGITVEWVPVPSQNTTAAFANGDYGMYWFTMGSNPTPRDVDNFINSSTQNPFGWSSPELEELLAAADVAIEPEEQAAVYKELSAYIVDQALFAPVFYINTNNVTTEDVKFIGDGTNNFTSIRNFVPAG